MFDRYAADLQRAIRAASKAGEDAMAAVLSVRAAAAAPPGAVPPGYQQGRGLGHIRPLSRVKPLATVSPLFPKAPADAHSQIGAVTGPQGQATEQAATLTAADVQAATDAFKEAFTRAMSNSNVGG